MITFNHLADAFIQSDLQMRRATEAVKLTTCECCDPSQFNL